MKDEYDFCGLKRGECNYQINADEKIATLEKALVLACENFNGRNCPVHKACPIDKDCKDCCADHFMQKVREQS